MTISHAEKSRYRALKLKKERGESGLFVVDGIKPVKEALAAGFPLEKIIFSENLTGPDRREIESFAAPKNIAITFVTQSEIEQISSLRNPEGVLAIAKIPEAQDMPISFPALYLWQINDPGNLGTIMRTALWFDIQTILISPDSVDIYSPKVVRAAMGALFRLSIQTDIDLGYLDKLLKRDNASLWATDMSGTADKPTIADERFVLAFGSESHGLPPEILQHSTGVIGINKYGYGESLNLAISVGIILNIIRQK